MTKPPNDNYTVAVKAKNDDRLTKQKFEMQLQGMGLIAFNEACKKRGETPQQLINDLLESFLIREGYLPDWWLNRQGIH